MPREKQKRGRRAEQKAQKGDTKRKHDDVPEEPVAKRVKSSDEADVEPFYEDRQGDYADDAAIPAIENEEMQDESGRPDSGDTPFYGLLDTEEQEYFSRASEMLELNQFIDDEERSLFVESVYREAEGKELKIACSQGCSRLMEKLISMSDVRQIRRIFNKFIGHFLHLVQHRFASHCCETLFINAAPAVMQKPSKQQAKKAEEEGETEPELSLADMFMTVIEELKDNWGYLLTERFASHTIRVLLLVLAGEPVDLSSTDSAVASRKKERLGAPVPGTEAETASSQKHSVPESFEPALKKIMSEMVSGVDDTYLRALASHPVGNPVLQVLLFLELSHFGKSSAKDPKSVLRRLVPDESFEEGTESATFIRGLLYDPVGSRLVETMVRYMPGKVFKNLYKNNIRERIGSLSRNSTAGYVVLKTLERLGKDDLQNAMELIIPEVPGLIERARLIVPRVLIERCVVRNVDTKPLARALKNAYSGDKTLRLRQMLRLDGPPESVQGPVDHEMKDAGEFDDDHAEQARAASAKSSASAPERLHGSLLTQAMLAVPGPLSELVYSSLLAQSPETILQLAQEPTSTRVVQQALTSPTSTPQFRRQFVAFFQGHLVDLAQNSNGSRVVDALWTATKDIFFVKERMAQELASKEMVLRDSFIGRAVWRNWSMDLYKRRRSEWNARAKGIERNQEGMEGSGERPKSKIELARERFAAKQNETEGKQAVSANS
ncbi:Nucleolar protein 9 [Penicillium chermesinum]|uniref:Nucleolar protein 9 n=1 Tax=Penicillium chermesinum TaxID=63820 RepID=A0A9W9TSP1_9EURO|nr:Nucleolar protein 9 [Penicillium chermesinum]KAJ5239737.1 Nucleolar protein 9 [Penicillium chermesinum]KAJ6166619.1 Nucleolar protein 9 [Penicillium chermesinum]